MGTLSRKFRSSFLVAPAVALAAVAVGVSGASPAGATSSCLCFHAVYTDLVGSVHDSAYDTVKKSWSDQIAPGSVAAASDPYAVKTFDNRYHIVYIDQAGGNLHDDFEDPATKKWTDLIPPASVKADTFPSATPVVVDFAEPKGGYTQHIVYVGADGRIHNNQFDPKANTWFDQVPPGSVPFGGSSVAGLSAVDEGGGFFRIVYKGNDVHLHQARFDANTGWWSDTIVPKSVLPYDGAQRVGFANDPTPSFHIVYLGVDGFVHNDREDLGTSTWYDQIPPGSIKAAPNTIPTFTLGNDGHDHVLYFGIDGFVHNDNFDPVTKTWFDQIPPGSTFSESSPNASTTYDNTFPVVYSDGTHIHVDVFTPSKGTWSDTIPPGSAKGIFGRAPAVANTDI